MRWSEVLQDKSLRELPYKIELNEYGKIVMTPASKAPGNFINIAGKLMLKWLWLSIVVILLDQGTKYLAESQLQLYESVTVLPFFNFTLVYNTGAAFSFLADAGGWQRWFFVGLSLTVSLGLIFWLYRLQPNAHWDAAAVALILGGALGNVIDRLWYGYVIDFIDLYYQSWHWPAFNIADSAITVGAALLILQGLFGQSAPAEEDQSRKR